MDKRKQMALRIYILFLLCALLSVGIILKIAAIQINEGNYWISVSEKYQISTQKIEAPRGSILSDDYRLLSVSTPKYSLYFDGGLSYLRKHNGVLFFNNLNQIAKNLNQIQPKYSMGYYKKVLESAYSQSNRYKKILSNLNYEQYKAIKKVPLVNLPSNQGGFILKHKEIRSYPYGSMAKRTVGLYRGGSGLVGVEKSYNPWLQGKLGKRIVKKIARGVYMPIDGSEIIPNPGKSIVSTINIEMQDETSSALAYHLKKNQADWGTCIVMEVNTGKIKAIANLTRNNKGEYVESYNHAVTKVEPGSTIKIFALMALLEDGHINLEDSVNINYGQWTYKGQLIEDSEHNSKITKMTTIKNAFETSSNVGIAKLINKYYSKNVDKFFAHFKRTSMDRLVTINIPGEQSPLIKTPDMNSWSSTTLIWSSFGYEMMMSPVSILTLYSAIANDGKMMQPYLVKEITQSNSTIKRFEPKVRVRSICSKATINKLKIALEGVVQNGTARGINNAWYSIAGKTGTSKIYSQKNAYNSNHYLASFAGYFPANKPKYACIVFVQNRLNSPIYYGAQVAAPIFKEVADKIMASKYYLPIDSILAQTKYIAQKSQLKQPIQTIKPNYDAKIFPNMKGWKLADAIFFCEANKINVRFIKGQGSIVKQSIPQGTAINNQLNNIDFMLQ